MSSAKTWAWPSPTPEELDAQIDAFKVHRRLGRGGMGAVYLATQLNLEREVAIKLLPEQLAVDPEFEARFNREARLMAKLAHPNIVPVFDFGETNAGHRFYVMEYVPGGHLGEEMRDEGLPVERAFSVFGQVCAGMKHAHDKGLIHRDLKPANILLGETGFVKIGDFGLAKMVVSTDSRVTEQLGLTNSRAAMGTPDYAAPEQLNAEPVDHRADLYSLGVLLYEMLTGSLPRGSFSATSSRNPDCPQFLDAVIERALQPEPGERFQSVEELLQAVLPGQQLRANSVSVHHEALPFPPCPEQPLCRIAVIPASRDSDSLPPFQWFSEVEQSNHGDLIQIASPSAGSHKHLVALKGTGRVCFFGGEPEEGELINHEENAAYVIANPPLKLTSEGHLVGGGAPAGEFSQLRCADGFALALRRDGQVVGIGPKLSRLNQEPHAFALQSVVQIEASRTGHAAALHHDGTISEILTSGSTCEVRRDQTRHYQRLISEGFAICTDGSLATIDPENPEYADLSESLSGLQPETIVSIEQRPAWALVRLSDGQWRVLARDRSTGGKLAEIDSEFADALRGAVSVFGLSAGHVVRLDYCVALFPV
tara:strand:- start:501 stop:2285 length:1785 start_codon:yes stop_codon:yes gene_type:complete